MPGSVPQPVRDPLSAGVTLVLGGGGFKGMAHIGVLRELQAQGIPVQRVVGTSVGALIGASYCHLGDAEAMHEQMLLFLASEGFQNHTLTGFRRRTGRVPLMRRLLGGIRRQVALERMFRRSSAFGGSALRFIVRSLVPKIDIAELRLPLAVCVLDLSRGEELLLSSGPLCDAVVASAAVPGFFPPVEWDGAQLCDAGIVNNLPTQLARQTGSERIVAVDLSADVAPTRPQAAGMELLLRAQEISTRLANRRWAKDADVVLTPALNGRHWLDTSNLPDVIEAGAAAARAAAPVLRELLDRPRQAG
jgi:NTE family protein